MPIAYSNGLEARGAVQIAERERRDDLQATVQPIQNRMAPVQADLEVAQALALAKEAVLVVVLVARGRGYRVYHQSYPPF